MAKRRRAASKKKTPAKTAAAKRSSLGSTATKRKAKRSKSPRPANANGANLGFEATLWAAADKLRGHMDAAVYKHVVLGLIFLKYISDAFLERYDDLAARRKKDYTDPEDRDEYAASNTFWVPPDPRWHYLLKNAKQTTIGKIIDAAMTAIERDNPNVKGVLAKDYARPSLDKSRLGELVDRTHRELSDEEIGRIANTYHAWRGEDQNRDRKRVGLPPYADIPGFCKSATTEEIAIHGHVLTPGRYVEAEAIEDDGEPFEEKMQCLSETLGEQFAESKKLEKLIWANLEKIGCGK